MFAHFARAFPEAPVYTSLYDRSLADLVPAERVRTSFLQAFPAHDRYFRWLAPLYPAAFESFDLSPFDTILSSTTAWAKGVKVPAGAVHVCYINTVSRFAFDYQRYVGHSFAGRLARPLIDRLSAWDRAAALRPTAFISNSRNVAGRVKAYYGRESYVLPCPVDVDRFTPCPGAGAGAYFAIASRLLPYKRIDLAIAAARLTGMRLVIAGSGPAEAALRAQAAGSPAELLGYIGDRALNDLIAGARAVILPGEEDFGLVPLEAAAAGTPTIAYRAGGALETIVEGRTGAFFDEPAAEALAIAMRTFDRGGYDAKVLRAHAEQFSPPRFIARLRAILEEVRAGGSAPPQAL